MEKFNYSINSLSKEEKKEVERIRSYYENKPLSDFELLKELHQKINRKIGILIGLVIAFTISFYGVGLHFIIDTDFLVAGIVLLVIGAILIIFDKMIITFFVNKIKDKNRLKILELVDKILKEEK